MWGLVLERKKKNSKPYIQMQGKEKIDAGRDRLFNLISVFQTAEKF